jgi:hypothetical protein
MSEFRKPLPTDPMNDHAEQHGHAYDEIQAIKAKDVELENQINKNEDKISALNHELDAIAESRVGGEWILSSDASTQGNMALGTQDLTGLENRLYINATDANGVVVNMDTIEVGDYIEIVEEHDVLNRATQDYGLYKVTVAYVDNYFDVELSEGRGFADMGRRFFVKAFKMSEGLDVAELDSRYSMKVHSHDNYALDSHGHSEYLTDLPSHNHDNYAASTHGHNDLASKSYVDTELGKKADTHSHPYAGTNHTHNYSPTSHTHSNYANSSHTHSDVASHTHSYASTNHTHSKAKMQTGTSSNPSLTAGEMYLNTSQKVVYVGV